MGHSAVAFVVVIGILVFCHELGHFLAARLCRVGVDVFSLGFGPKLFKKKIGRTEYCVSAIPLGGYVK
ncbi:MAG: site-2 protease family protein, partial [Proteobacteria bacterium]|nr:site-2 protease family protein [Pseudomonadota bacterium]